LFERRFNVVANDSRLLEAFIDPTGELLGCRIEEIYWGLQRESAIADFNGSLNHPLENGNKMVVPPHDVGRMIGG
jgi:hypothetical protein